MSAQLPDPQTAYQTIFDGVHQRAFFHRLGQLRPEYAPQNEKQAADLLRLAGNLRLVTQEETMKTASASVDPFAAANMALESVLGQAGYGSMQQNAQAALVQQAAFDLAQDGDIYNSVIALKAHEADQYLAALESQR